MPTYWLVADLLSRGLLNEIPLERVPNHVNLDPALLGTSWDRGARFHLPWQAGFTGIAYNPALTGRDIRSFADLLDPALRGPGRHGVGDAGGARLLHAGPGRRPQPGHGGLGRAPPSTGWRRSWRRARSTRFTGNEYVDALKSGEFAACLAWSGDVIQLQAERPDLRFVIPAEGGIRWFDSHGHPQGGRATWPPPATG